MRGLAEPPIVGDGRDRAFDQRRVGEFVLDFPESLRADPTHERIRLGNEQLM